MLSPLALDAIGASAEQRAWMICVMDLAAVEMRARRELAARLRAHIADAGDTGAPDPAALQALDQLKQDIQAARLQALIEAAAVLTVAQRAALTLEHVRLYERRHRPARRLFRHRPAARPAQAQVIVA